MSLEGVGAFLMEAATVDYDGMSVGLLWRLITYCGLTDTHSQGAVI